MPKSTLTSKGQITIPKEVRDKLGLRTGDVVHFHVREDGVVEMQAQNIDLMSLFGMLKTMVDPAMLGQPLTLEEIDEVIGQAVIERYKRAVGDAHADAAQPTPEEKSR